MADDLTALPSLAAPALVIQLGQKGSQDRIVEDSLPSMLLRFLPAKFLLLSKQVPLDVPLHFNAIEMLLLSHGCTTSLGE